MQRCSRLSLVSLLFVLAAAVPAAAQVTVFDGTFSRLSGEPAAARATFAAVDGKGTITLHNGGLDRRTGRPVSAATVRLNGHVVFDERQFNQRVVVLESEVDLLAENDLEVLVEGKPGSVVAIRIVWPPSQIGEFWNRLAALYESSFPSEQELADWFAENVAPDFVQGATDRDEMLAEWLAGSGPAVGMTFSPVVTGSIDLTGTPYTKGYQVRLDYAVGGTSGSLPTAMVFDGTRWLWYGDQQWVWTELMSNMGMLVPWDGSASRFESGLGITLWDEHGSFAYRHGVRSAIVTGPGLPASGLTLYHMYPLPYLRIYPGSPSNPAGDWFVPLDDAAISAIPDGADYTIRLYSEPADTVGLDDEPLTMFVKTNPKPPLLNTELNASLFPTLLFPTTHKSSDLASLIGGPIELQWTNPPAATVRYAGLGLTKDSATFENVASSVTPGLTSVTLDTTAFPWALGWRAGNVYLGSADEHGRAFGMHWLINPWQ